MSQTEIQPYTAVNLHYWPWTRWRDGRNGRRDRRKDIVNYRRNKSTKYLQLIKSEVTLRSKHDATHYERALGKLRSNHAEIASDIKQLSDQLNELETQITRFTGSLRQTQADFIRRATLERQAANLNRARADTESQLAEQQNQLHQLGDQMANLTKIYQANQQTIQSWGEMRARRYVDALFKKLKTNDPRRDEPKARPQPAAAKEKSATTTSRTKSGKGKDK